MVYTLPCQILNAWLEYLGIIGEVDTTISREV